MTKPARKFPCSEADYLAAHNIDLHHAARYPLRFGPAAIREVVEAGITPEQAELAPPNLNASEVVAFYDDEP